MIAAAERLIAERGIAALTLKDVQLAANQSNKSAAQYHFGSREGLLTAVLDNRMEPVNRRRQEILDNWVEHGVNPTARQAVEAMVGPLAAETVGRNDSHYARFLMQVISDPALTDIVEAGMQAESLRRIRTLLIGHTSVEPATAKLRVGSLMSFVLVTLARFEGQRRSAEATAGLVADLVEVCLAILSAPDAAAAESVSPTDREGVSS
ncbi:MAG: TetR/AcrR family transcriptional regulator [Propionibacterium sp.]|nr:TetR/AcrR family transcriptional regulator [Propionibacterium sp.]